MLDAARQWWEAHALEYQAACRIPIDILYGPGCPNEDALGLMGPLAGRRVLELGCGGAQAAIACARRGAIAAGVDVSAVQIEFGRRLAREAGVAIELYQRDMADLAPIADASQDVVFTAFALGYVDDLAGCLREVVRVLRPGGVFVCGVGHPFFPVVDPATLRLRRSYFAVGLYTAGGAGGSGYQCVSRTTAEYVNALIGAGLVFERMLEPDSRQRHAADPWYGRNDYSPAMLALLPPTLVLKARKP
jgi:SAM-dependent methyltransferase